jgi:hydroxymethylpyrimidine pyrophosphatase-like HAD family hydrolase
MTTPSPALLALDLDGTLVRRDGTVHPDDLAAVAAAQAAGVQVSIVTGRLYSGVRELAAELGIRGTVVCADGAELVDPVRHRVVRHRRIQGQDALDLLSLVRDHGLALFLMARDRIAYDELGLPLARYVSNWTKALERVPSVLSLDDWSDPAGISGLVAVGEDAGIAEVMGALEGDPRFGADSFVVQKAPGALFDAEHPMRGMLVHTAGVDKGRAIADLAEEAGTTLADVVAVGDWINDIPMLRAAGRSFAMGHAEAPVAAAATDQLEAAGWEGGGVAEAVREVWGL